jgi:murein DD-endopeptidase MepM/ murein hydrolase activator NlpD
MSITTIDLSKKENKYIQTFDPIRKPNFILVLNDKNTDNILPNNLKTAIIESDQGLRDVVLNSKVFIICLFSLVSEIINNVVYQSYLSIIACLEILDDLPSHLSYIKTNINHSLELITNSDTRYLWWLNTKLEIRTALNNLIDTLLFVLNLIKHVYLAFIVVTVLVGINFGSTTLFGFSEEDKSPLSKTINASSINTQESVELVDSSQIIALSRISQDSDRKAQLSIDGIIEHKTNPNESLEMISEMYGVSTKTIAFNNQIQENTQNLPETLYIPWTNGYIYKADNDISAQTLQEIYGIDQNLIYSENESNFDQELGKFKKGTLIFLPTDDLDAIAKANKAEEERKENLKRAEEERKKKEQILANSRRNTYSNSFSKDRSAGFIWPTQGTITRCVVGNHIACDIANSSMPPVFSVQSGRVAAVYRFTVTGYGLAVVIDHGNGLQTLYAHLSEIYVSEGQTVQQGQSIGRMGSTGFSSGVHLHFEVRENGNRKNPLLFLP